MCYTGKLSDLVISEIVARRKIEDMKSIDTTNGYFYISLIAVAKKKYKDKNQPFKSIDLCKISQIKCNNYT